MDAIEGVLAIHEEIERARTHRILRAAADEAWEIAESLMLTWRGCPIRPFLHVADPGDTGPILGFLSDRDAVADRFAAVHDEIKEVIVLIDDDRARRLFTMIVDDVPAERLGDRPR